MSLKDFINNIPEKICLFIYEDFKECGIDIARDEEARDFAFRTAYEDLKSTFETIKNNEHALIRFEKECEALPSNYGFHSYLNRFEGLNYAG